MILKWPSWSQAGAKLELNYTLNSQFPAYKIVICVDIVVMNLVTRCSASLTWAKTLGLAKFVTIDVINIDVFALLLKTDLNLHIMFDKICCNCSFRFWSHFVAYT